jgi:ABC-type Fe3+-hydroxamate transport system substrate-binding protein
MSNQIPQVLQEAILEQSKQVEKFAKILADKKEEAKEAREEYDMAVNDLSEFLRDAREKTLFTKE